MRGNQICLILAIILLSSVSKSSAQQNEMADIPIKKNAISFSILGSTPALGFVYERIISEKISAELGVGFLSLGAGVKIYPRGLQINYYYIPDSRQPQALGLTRVK
jgi:hypothetical protein